MLGTKTEEQVIELFPENTILIAYRGSVAHGMYVPNSDPNSIDDIDLMGIFMAPVDNYIGINSGNTTVEKFVDEYDTVSYEFIKMIRLLLKSNPNVLSMLHLKPEYYLYLSPLGKTLIEHRDCFSSLEAYNAFAGYAAGQLHKMSAFTKEGYMGAKRKRLVDRLGYDSKNAAHCIRLLRMAIEFLQTGKLNVFREHDAEDLLEIKLGKRSLESIKLEAEDLFAKIKIAKTKSSLPEKPNSVKINEMTQRIIYNYIVENQAVYLKIADIYMDFNGEGA